MPKWLTKTWSSPSNQDPGKDPMWNFKGIPLWLKIVGGGSIGIATAVEIYWLIKGIDIEEATIESNETNLTGTQPLSNIQPTPIIP